MHYFLFSWQRIWIKLRMFKVKRSLRRRLLFKKNDWWKLFNPVRSAQHLKINHTSKSLSELFLLVLAPWDICHQKKKKFSVHIYHWSVCMTLFSKWILYIMFYNFVDFEYFQSLYIKLIMWQISKNNHGSHCPIPHWTHSLITHDKADHFWYAWNKSGIYTPWTSVFH